MIILIECNIQKESTLYLEIKSMIYLKRETDGRIIELEVKTNETIEQIKQKIQIVRAPHLTNNIFFLIERNYMTEIFCHIIIFRMSLHI